jgi:hypothetical protein
MPEQPAAAREAMPAPARRRARGVELAAGAALAIPGLLVLGFLIAPILSSESVLAARDVESFHLPLRSAFQRLAAYEALPEWNPWIHAGQPILSNPNYAAFYPPTWAVLPLAPHRALGVLVALHAAFAFAGAWLLVRRLGGEPPAAALGATTFAGGGFFLGLGNAFNFLCGMAWFPWVLLAGERLFGAPRGRAPAPALLLASALTLQLLAGEPVAVLIGAIALGCLALGHPAGAGRSTLRLAAGGILALGLAAMQLLPTLHRLGEGTRGEGLDLERATVWSMPPARVAEIVAPRLWGDPLRHEEGLFFGWAMHDRHSPYVPSLHAGLLTAILALSALAALPIARRRFFLLALAAGFFLALGRFNPVYGELHDSLPLLRLIRYPEKLAVLGVAMLPFAAALAWQHLVAARRRGEVEGSRPPLALAAALALAGALAAGALSLWPEIGEVHIRSGSPFPPSPADLEKGLAYLRGEALASTALAAGAVVLLLLVSRRRVPELALGLGALGLVALDLGHHGRHLLPVAPSGLLLTAPPPAREASELGGRVFSPGALAGPWEAHFRIGPQEHSDLRHNLLELSPYTANLWGMGYALHSDYDLMLTTWGRHALELLLASAADAEEAWRILGAWDVAAVVVRRSLEEQKEGLRLAGHPPLPVKVAKNPWRLARYRFPRQVVFTEAAVARELLAEQGFDVSEREICLAAPSPPTVPLAPAALLEIDEGGKRIRLRYRAAGPAFLVAAVTYDEGWQATVAEEPLPLCPTALGQIGVLLPPGEHVLELRYRDPWVRLGAAVSAASFLLGLLLVVRARR